MIAANPEFDRAMSALETGLRDQKQLMDEVIKPDIDRLEALLLGLNLKRTIWLDICESFAIGWAETSHGKYRLAVSVDRMHLKPTILRDSKFTYRVKAHPHLAKLANLIRHELKI